MKIGILGTGMIVKALMKTIDRLDFSRAVVLGTKETEEETARMCREHGLDGYFLDYDELLESDVDTIYVALPNHLHADFAKKALLHGKHVIIEKPITSNARQLRDLMETARERGRMIFEAMNIHYLPIFGQLREHLPDLGPIKIVTMDYGTFKLVSIGAKDCKAPVRCTIQGTDGCIVIAKPVNQMDSFELILNDGTVREYRTEHAKHRLYYEFMEFQKIMETEDWERHDRMLEISLAAEEILEEGRRQNGIFTDFQ